MKSVIQNIVQNSLKNVQQGSILNPLLNNIKAWQSVDTEIYIGGVLQEDWVNSSATGGSGTTIMPAFAIRQDGYITSIKILPYISNSLLPWKLKLFEYNDITGDLDFVREREFSPTGTDAQTVILSTPLECQMAQIPALYIPESDAIRNSSEEHYVLIKRAYESGDILTSATFSARSAGSLHLELNGIGRPYMAICGASTFQGMNIGDGFKWASSAFIGTTESNVHSVPGGNPAAEIAYRIKSRIPTMNYQNHARSSLALNEGLIVGIPQCLAVKPKILIVGYGLNDITDGRTWAEFETDLDTLKVMFDSSDSEELIISEMQPRTSQTDADALILRTWNANIATWCTANNATLLVCHDELAQIRTSTGELDDFKDGYSFDGTHLTEVGVDKYGEIMARFIS